MHPRDGGPPRVVSGSALALRNRGQDVTVLTSLASGEQKKIEETWSTMLQAGVELKFVRKLTPLDILNSKNMQKNLLPHVRDADVIHIHSFWTPLVWIVVKLAIKYKKPYFISTHGVLDKRAFNNTIPKLLKKQVAIKFFGVYKALNQSAGSIFGSEAEVSQSQLPSGHMKIFCVPNGVNLPSLQISENLREAKKAQLFSLFPQMAKWNRTILYFSRLHPEKGLDMLMIAFDQVAKTYPNVGLIAAGIGEDLEYQEYVEGLIASSSARNRIVLTTQLSGEKWHFLYGYCDLFVLPSHAEGFSVALIEAMSHSAPALITRYCHLPEVATRGAGLIAEPNANSIAEKLDQLLELSVDELTAMGRNARKLVEEKYTWSAVSLELIKLYDHAIANRSDGE
jgi:glycosyltransferase involved in cell wall biosynthesis